MSAIQQALSKMRKARSVDEGDDCADELARAARKDVKEIIDLYHTTKADAFALVWCLQGITEDAVIELFKQALQHKDSNVRWAAMEGLKHSSRRTLIPIFIAALNDRSDMVRGVAVDWLKSHGDASAIGPLQRLSKLPRLIRNSPGTVKQAERAVRRLRSKAT